MTDAKSQTTVLDAYYVGLKEGALEVARLRKLIRDIADAAAKEVLNNGQ